ncbi:MAG: hypothetical protein Q9166_004001 [cf. Caloplaca sp. 2 TL-2023]
MVLRDITDILDRIRYWIQSDDKVPLKMEAAYTQKGGWEGWAQVEIAYLVQTKYPNVTIDREVNVYTGTQKENDFVIIDNTDATKPKQIVELKCERGTQKPVEFRKSFMNDITKINTLPIGAAYKPAKAYAIAISCTDATHKLLFETEWGGITVKAIECRPGIFTWWYERDVV